MAGRKQHYIPQALLRGFEATKVGKHTQVWVFRQGREAYVSSTEGVAAQRDFYSPLSIGQVTLDDQITNYESAVLTPAITELRETEPGPVAADLAASAVTHLSVRAAFVRGSFSEAAQQFLEHFSQVLRSHESTRAAMGVDSPNSQSMLAKTLEDEVRNQFGFLDENARARIGKLVHFRVRERFASDYTNLAEQAHLQVELLKNYLPQAIVFGHARALEQALVPQARMEKLRAMNWRVLQVNEPAHFVLPDCLALASGKEDFSELIPYSISNDEKLAGVVMPVSATRLLIGSFGEATLELNALNDALAECSLDFFVSSKCDAATKAAACRIGHSVSRFSEKVVKDEAFAAPLPKQAVAIQEQHDVQTQAELRVLFEPESSRSSTLEAALREQVQASELSSHLGRLEALIVTNDVVCSMKTHGFPLNGHEKQEVQFGTCHHVVTPAGMTCQIFVPIEVARLLTTGDDLREQAASRLIRHHLGRAAYVDFLASSVSQEELERPRPQLEVLLLLLAQKAASLYFGARHSAPEYLGAEEFRQEDSVCAKVIAINLEGFQRTRQQFLADSNADIALSALAIHLDSLLSTMASASILRSAGEPTWEQSECASILEAAGLKEWFALFARDLDAYFTTPEQWNGLGTLSFLSAHAERVLWGFGFFLSPRGKQILVEAANEHELAVISAVLGTPKPVPGAARTPLQGQ